MTGDELDPNWEWIEVKSFARKESEWVRGACRHLPEAVTEVRAGEELVARLCTNCDAQFPGDGPYSG